MDENERNGWRQDDHLEKQPWSPEDEAEAERLAGLPEGEPTEEEARRAMEWEERRRGKP